MSAQHTTQRSSHYRVIGGDSESSGHYSALQRLRATKGALRQTFCPWPEYDRLPKYVLFFPDLVAAPCLVEPACPSSVPGSVARNSRSGKPVSASASRISQQASTTITSTATTCTHLRPTTLYKPSSWLPFTARMRHPLLDLLFSLHDAAILPPPLLNPRHPSSSSSRDAHPLRSEPPRFRPLLQGYMSTHAIPIIPGGFGVPTCMLRVYERFPLLPLDTKHEQS